MRDADERVEPPGEDADANTKAESAASRDAESVGTPTPPRGSGKKAGAGQPVAHETARLVCAVAAAVALGVACGLWINARLAAAAASALPPAQTRLLPEAPADVRTAAAPQSTEASPAEHLDNPSALTEAATSPGSEEPAGADTPSPRPARTPDKESRDALGAGSTAASSAAKADGRAEPGKIAGRAGEASAVKSGAEATRAQGGEAPCTPYTSAGALAIRSGGAATIVVGGPGRQGRVAVSTPDWSDVVVLSEGPAGGGKGWMKYSVRSVSNRAGVYALHVKTPCGSQTIPVTVGRP